MNSIFIAEGDGFLPTDWARGPWGHGLLHGGASAALLAHAIEPYRDDPAWVVARLTVDLLRPVRQALLRTSVQVVRPKGRIQLIDAWLHQDDQVVARASVLMVRGDPHAPAFAPLAAGVPAWQTLPALHFNFGDGASFIQATRGRYWLDDTATQAADGPRVAGLWLSVELDFLPGRPMTAFEYVAALSDHANPVGTITTYGRSGFINADISLHLHRELAGRWLAFECPGRPSHDGVATTHTVLHDAHGPLGSATVSALANALPGRTGGQAGVIFDAAPGGVRPSSQYRR